MDRRGDPLTSRIRRDAGWDAGQALARLGRRIVGTLPVLVPLAFLAIFFVWPVAAIIGRGLHPGDHWEMGVVGRVLSDPAYRQVAWFTLWEATASTAVTLVVALPMAALFGRFEFPGKRVLWALLIVPFVLPTVVVGVAFLALLGPGGALGVDLRGSIWLILIAHAFFNVAVVVRTVGGLWGNLDPRLEEAARTLGASRLRAFREVTLPRLRPAIAAAASIVFLFCFTSFGVVLLLGGIRARTLEVEIYDQTTQLLHLDVAAVLAVLQLVGVGLALVLYGRHQQREGSPARWWPEARWRGGPGGERSGPSWSPPWPSWGCCWVPRWWCWPGARSPRWAPAVWPRGGLWAPTAPTTRCSSRRWRQW